jgi:hypothetical protein
VKSFDLLDERKRQTRLEGLRSAFRRGSHKCAGNCGRTVSANKECCLACSQRIEQEHAADIPLAKVA